MRKKFPESYPYSNKHGLVFTRETLNLVAEYFLNRKKPRSLDIGLELSYILLWTMEKATDHLHFIKLTYFFFKKIIRRKNPNKLNSSGSDELLDRIIDPETYETSNNILRSVDVERIVGDESRIEEIARMRARDRNKEIEKLRARWMGD